MLTASFRTDIPYSRQAVCDAAAEASKLYGEWVPQRWLDLFMRAYERDGERRAPKKSTLGC